MEPNQCPWSWLEASNMTFCEERLCAWIVEPTNAYSNIGFIIVGIWLLNSKLGEKSLRLHFGIMSILVGIFSFSFHATGTAFFHVFDTTSMIFLTNSLVLLNMQRMGLIKKILPTFIISTTIMFLLSMFVNEMLGLVFFTLGVIAALAQEYIIYKKRLPTERKYLYYTLLIFGAALLAWFPDKSGLMCDPTNHYVQGHTLWHLFNALSFWSLMMYYKQFRITDTLKSRS